MPYTAALRVSLSDVRQATSSRTALALSLVVSIALSACATRPPSIPPSAEVQGRVPSEGLPTVARILANQQPIELAGFWNNPKDREEFEKHRSENIDRRVSAGMTLGGGGALQCLLNPLCIVALPIILPFALIGAYADARIRAGHNEPSIPISEQDGARHVALFEERLSGVSLREHTWRVIESSPAKLANEAEYPRLLVSMASARVSEGTESLRIVFVAQAQAFPSAGVQWTPTEHAIDFDFSPKYDYTPDIPRILDALAKSVVSAYLPQHPYGVEKRYWDDLDAKDASQLQAYLDRYPQGAFVALARSRLEDLAEERADARKLAAKKAAAENAAENTAWESARNKDAAKVQAYLDRYPKGKFAVLAREQVTKLRAQGSAATTADKAALRALFASKARARPEFDGRWTGATSGATMCPTGFYKISIENGIVTGVVEWRDGGTGKSEVAGYVREDGVVSITLVADGRFGRSGDVTLMLESEHLRGRDTQTCNSGVAALVTLSRN